MNHIHTVILFLILFGVIMIFRKQNIEKFVCNGKMKSPKCLNDLKDLNTWALNPPTTELNKFCQLKINKKQDLNEGQHCVANCASVLKKPGWIPGGKLIKTVNGFGWENGNGKFILNIPSKRGYCNNVNVTSK